MKPGKLTPEELARYVFPRCGVRRSDVMVHAGIGRDAAVVRFGDEVAVLTTDPITGAGKRAGWLAVHVAANDVATCGASPVGVLITLLLAPDTAADDARVLMEDADLAARDLEVEILGGHSEVTADLARSLIVVAAMGRARRDRYVTTDGARPGDTILLTKSAGLEGTAVLASDYAEPLASRLSLDLLQRARGLIGQISVVPEALAAVQVGVSAMHDATEGGVVGALAELATASGHGVDVDVERIPVRPETHAICDVFGVNPLELVSSGALVIATAYPEPVVRAIAARGVDVAAIGRVVDGPSRLRTRRDVGGLIPPDRDALWHALERGPIL